MGVAVAVAVRDPRAPPTPAPDNPWRCLMPCSCPHSLAGVVGQALLSAMGRPLSFQSSWSLLCPDNYPVFIWITCKKCVIGCKIKVKSCREPMRYVLGAVLPPLWISPFHCSDWFLCCHLALSPMPSLPGCWKGYALVACTSSLLSLNAFKHNSTSHCH